jgi:transcriptional regulator with XRE-family HTH domain
VIKIFLERLQLNGWTQKAIAEKAGISQNMISNFLKGKTCTVETLVKIAKAFNVSTDTVLGLDSKPEEPEPPKKRSAHHHRNNSYAE